MVERKKPGIPDVGIERNLTACFAPGVKVTTLNATLHTAGFRAVVVDLEVALDGGCEVASAAEGAPGECA